MLAASATSARRALRAKRAFVSPSKLAQTRLSSTGETQEMTLVQAINDALRIALETEVESF